MTDCAALIDLIARLGAELDFDVAKDVACGHGRVDAVWCHPSLPLAAIAVEPLDLSNAPVLPMVAFVGRAAPMLQGDELALTVAFLEETRAPLRILVIARQSRHSPLAPILQSVDQLRRQDDDSLARTRIAASLRAGALAPGRTIVMLQSEFVEWARRLREVRPRSYSAESLFNRTGAID